jgi:CubicO group peptidase (beta-lactamase class C family)
LRDRNLLSLDDPVTRWVPELRRIHAPDDRMDSITIRMLLSHSSGLQAPTWPWTEGEPWEPFEPTAWEQLVAMMPYQRLHFQPGAKYSYSNPGYIYLARIIEGITGDLWAVYVQKNLWTPLGMNRSYVGATPYHLAKDRSHGYRIAGSLTDIGADFDPGVTIPNSGWNAPLDDVATYIASLTGSSDKPAVLSRKSLEEIWRPILPTGLTLPEFSQVGLGFFSTTVDGRRIVGHTGDQAGYRSFVYFDPERRTGLVMVFNTTNDAAPGRERLEELARVGITLLR